MKKPRNEILRLKYHDERVDIAAKVRRTGKDLIVFLHGIGCNKESFNEAFRAKALRAYSICAFDFPGHGKSSRFADELYSLQSYAEITNRVTRDLAFSRTYVVGHSMGGAVGIIATQSENSIQCLVSADGNLVAEDCGLVSRKIADQSTGTFVREGFNQFLGALQSSSRRDYGAWFNWCRDADPHALHQAAKSLVEWSDSGKLLELFNALNCKAYLYGGQDNKDYLLHQIDAEVSAVPSASHFMMVDNPASFYQALAGVLTLQRVRMQGKGN
jgi:pimeloyl-ACP methyl ester carboxylesterase